MTTYTIAREEITKDEASQLKDYIALPQFKILKKFVANRHADLNQEILNQVKTQEELQDRLSRSEELITIISTLEILSRPASAGEE